VNGDLKHEACVRIMPRSR